MTSVHLSLYLPTYLPIAGCAFGVPHGLCLAGGSYMVACLPPFLLSRRFLRDGKRGDSTPSCLRWLADHPLLSVYTSAVGERPFAMTVLLRLSPALPSPAPAPLGPRD